MTSIFKYLQIDLYVAIFEDNVTLWFCFCLLCNQAINSYTAKYIYMIDFGVLQHLMRNSCDFICFVNINLVTETMCSYTTYLHDGETLQVFHSYCFIHVIHRVQ